MQDTVDHAQQQAKLALIHCLLTLLQISRCLSQVIKQNWRQIFNHVVHLAIEVVRSEHVAVLLADLLDRLKPLLDIRHVFTL